MAQRGFRSSLAAPWAVILLLAAEGLCQNPPPAQSPSIQPDPIVVTVSAEAIPLSASSASVTILTRDFVENSRAESMADLLRQVPFLYLSQTGGRGGLTTVSLRGGESNFTLVMIDGVPVNDTTNLLGGAVDFSTLSTDNVERIEIVRGPMSSLYGSEGIGGVINILTRGGGDEP
ncbi:MAG: TonB-dependent receptor plug domain-containing protein, partial [Acidobacteriota bacterium]|nr:TonB-dependent receptor plug domain-containing protein [Acidobacteriota bacterium]